ncbi:MAG: hypothetical protein JW888_14805 [Pirellulales bacterium]|nr:hypothetical protein [Pirellulales bacterium]
MEILNLLFFLIDVVAELIVPSGALADIFLWIKSSPNRKKRRAARRESREVPKRDSWNLAFVVCTTILLVVVVLLIVRVVVTGR